MRRNGVTDLSDVRYVVFESRGQVSVVPESAPADRACGLLRDLVGPGDSSAHRD